MKLGEHEGDPSPPGTGFRTAKSRPCLLVWVELSHASWCTQQIKGPQVLERNGTETWQRLIDPGKDKDWENQPSVVLWMRQWPELGLPLQVEKGMEESSSRPDSATGWLWILSKWTSVGLSFLISGKSYFTDMNLIYSLGL